MTEQTTHPDIDGPLVDALADYMMAVSGRRPTQSEMWDIFWSAADAIERAAKGGAKKAGSDGP